MTRVRVWGGFSVLFLLVTLQQVHFAQAAYPAPTGQDSVLKAADIKGKSFPDKVFFRGKVTTVQMSNTGGIQFSDDAYVLAGLVDNSGYSSQIRDKYQGYLFSEVTLEIGGQKLAPGAYGFGFLTSGKFVVMDIGGHDVFQVASIRDTEIKRPVPLQVMSAPAPGKYRLYVGREYVEISRAP